MLRVLGGEEGRKTQPGYSYWHMFAEKWRCRSMWRFAGATVVFGLLATIPLPAQNSSAAPAKTASKAPGPASGLAADQALIGKYCAGCHSQKLKSGGLALEGLDLTKIGDRAETGEKIVRKVRAGFMPPVNMPRPEPAARVVSDIPSR